MKKLLLVNILVNLLIGGPVQAVPYTPYRGDQRISYSSSAGTAPTSATFRSTSTDVTPVGYTSSASLNANGIARAPKSGLRSSLGGGRGNLDRDDDDEATGSIGNNTPVSGGSGLGSGSTDVDTPVGDVPMTLFLLLGCIYIIWIQKVKKFSKTSIFGKKIKKI